MNLNVFLMAITTMFVVIAWSSALPTGIDGLKGLKAWESFVNTYHKTYASDAEYEARKEQFLKNYKSLENQRKKFSSARSYRIGVTKFSDLSPKEFLRQYTGFVKPSEEQLKSDLRTHPLAPTGSLSTPVNLDYRNNSILTEVKDQKTCGSCWAFSAIAILEAAYNWKTNTNSTHLSEQHLVDCDLANSGCMGGWPHKALEYLSGNGAAPRSSYSYTNANGDCKSDLALEKYGNFKYSIAENLSDTDLRDTLSTYGPLSVAIDAGPLQSYSGGILSNRKCGEINHAVNLVGYVTSGDGAPYYILRNSWGSDWGEGGYFRVAATNSCPINEYVVAVNM